MFAASKLMSRIAQAFSALSGATISVPNTSPIAGATQSVTCGAVNGTPPFTYEIENQAAIIRGTASGVSAQSTTINYTAAAGDTSLACRVTDSISASLLSSATSISVTFNTSVSISISTTAPAIGATMTLTATPTASAGGVYQWFFRAQPLNGSFTSYTAFGGSSSTQVTGAALNGETYDFYCTYTNAAGTTASNVVTAVTPGNTGVTIFSSWPGFGATVSLSASPNWRPAGAVDWYYRDNSGSTWVYFTSGLTATSGVINIGESFSFYAQAINASGAPISNTITHP